MDNGFIKLHRKLIEWEWFTDQKTFSVFMYLLLSANHADGAWQGNVVKRGQLITGRKSIAKATGLTERQVRTSLANLKKTGETTSKSTNRFTVVTICNYNKYQIKENKNDQQTANKRPTSDQQTTTNKNEKNEKKDKHEEASLMMKDKIIRLLPGVETVYEFKLEKWKTKRETSKPVMDLNLNLMDWMRRASEKIPKDTKTEERESNRKKMEAYTGPPL